MGSFVVVNSHPRSLDMVLLDRLHTASY